MLRGLELAQQALHIVDIGRAVLAVARISILGRAAGEIRSAFGMRSGMGPVGNAVAVHVEVAAEVFSRLQQLVGHHLAAIVRAFVVPGQRFAEPVLHADVQVEHDEDWCLQAVGEVERQRGEVERFLGVLRKQEHVLGVPVRCIGARQDIRLLRARRHAG